MNFSFLVSLFFSLIPMFGWGIIGVLAAKLSRTVGALAGGALIQLFALLITILVWPLFFNLPQNINWPILFILGAIGAVTYFLYCRSLEIGKIPIVIPISSAWAIITASLGILLLKETVGLVKILSITVVVTGVIILSLDWQALKNIKISTVSSGVLPAILVAFGWGVSYFLLGPVSRQMGWFFTTLGNRIFMVIFLLAFFLSQKGKSLSQEKIPWKILLTIALLDVLAFTSYNLAVSRYEVSYVSVISSASPLVTVFLASLFIGEKTNLIQKIGIALVIVGIIGLQLR